jgi:flagellar basal body rod protein FlgB
MDRPAFSAAFRQLTGKPNEAINNLYHDLHCEEQRSATVTQNVSESNLQSLRSEIASFEAAIQEIKQNNALHERCIYS